MLQSFRCHTPNVLVMLSKQLAQLLQDRVRFLVWRGGCQGTQFLYALVERGNFHGVARGRRTELGIQTSEEIICLRSFKLFLQHLLIDGLDFLPAPSPDEIV